MDIKPQSKRIIAVMKDYWISNTQVILLLGAGSSDRRIREIRECPPDGYKFEQKYPTIDGKKATYLVYSLFKENTVTQLSLAV